MRCKAENTHLECQSSATRNFWRGAMSAVRIVMAAGEHSELTLQAGVQGWGGGGRLE